MKHLVLLVMVGLMGMVGCSHAPPPKTTLPKTTINPRCEILGKMKGRFSIVVVERNCAMNRITTVSVVVMDTRNKGKDAAEEASTFMLKTLGFKPKLAIFGVSKLGGKQMMLFVVVGPAE